MAKHIVITGGNQGIGYHMAEEFLREGNEVAVLDLETERLEELQKKYKGQLLFLYAMCAMGSRWSAASMRRLQNSTI